MIGGDDLLAAAFGDTPNRDPGTPVITTLTSENTDFGWHCLLAALVKGGHGRYASAATVLTALCRAPNTLLAGCAATALAAHRRQLGCHACARELDGLAIRRLSASGTANPAPSPLATKLAEAGLTVNGARADALLGLSADALGLGRIGEARRLHDAARTAAARGPSCWRTEVRTCWVAAEIRLAGDRPAEAATAAERALGTSSAHLAMRHSVKSELVLGASLATMRSAEAPGVLRSALKRATTYRLRSLSWPAALLLADLDPENAWSLRLSGRETVLSILRESDHSDYLCAMRSPWLPWNVLRTGDALKSS